MAKAMLQNDEAGIDQTEFPGNIVEAAPPPFQIYKTFPPRGKWQQYRLAASSKFCCCGCEKSKNSKLVAIKGGRWGELWCNGCYGTSVAAVKPQS